MNENQTPESAPEREPVRLEDVRPQDVKPEFKPQLPEEMPVIGAVQPAISQPDSAPATVQNAGPAAGVAGKGSAGAVGAPLPAGGAGDRDKPSHSANQVVDGEELSQAAVEAQGRRLLPKLVLLLERRITAALEAMPADGKLSLAEICILTELLVKAKDLQMADHWTQRLQRAIERNPSLGQHVPGAPGFRKVAGMAAKTKKASHVDGRTRGGQVRGKLAAMGGASADDLPQG
jgi:hypothetical protein